MAKKNDLEKIFNVEGLITKKTLFNETTQDLDKKSPNTIVKDMHSLLNHIDEGVESGDINIVLSSLDSIELRVVYLIKVAENLKNMLKGM